MIGTGRKLRHILVLVLTAVFVMGTVFASSFVNARAEENDDIAMEEQETQAATGSEGQSGSSITYTTPTEAFNELGDKVAGVFRFIGDFFNGIKEKAGVGAFIGAIAVAVLLVALLLVSLAICFKKAGVPVYWAFVPGANLYYAFKVGWEANKIWTYLLGIVAIILFGTLSNVKEIPFGSTSWVVPGIITTVLVIISAIGWIIFVVYTIRLAQGWAEGYNVHFMFGVGILILPFIFIPLLAFLPTKYVFRLGEGQVKVD